MKVGVVFSATPKDGGVYDFTKSILMNSKNKDELIILKYKGVHLSNAITKKFKVFEIYKSNDILSKLFRLFAIIFNINIEKYIYYSFPFLKQIDFYYAPTSSTFPHVYLNKSFCFTLHDLQHKYYPKNFSFIEILSRNFIFKTLIKKSRLIHCESEHVKSDILKFFNYTGDKILQLPLPSDLTFYPKRISTMSINSKFKIDGDFIFYPAKFWAHKNHILLIKKACEIHKRFKLKILFTGGTPEDVKKLNLLIEKYDVSKLITVVGYIKKEELNVLLQTSRIVCIPSLFESISIPVMEAFLSKKIIIASNIKGIKSQFMDARFLFDPSDENSLIEILDFALGDSYNREKILEINYRSAKELIKKGEYFIDEILKKCMN